MPHILLIGAGFSRNWGGWLASEVNGFLLTRQELDSRVKKALGQYRDRGGFESALAEIQQESIRSQNPQNRQRLESFQNAIDAMFSDMDKGFASASFEPQNHVEYLVRTFLVRFDAIFSLNQDTLLERCYLDANVQLGSNGRWNGWQIPGMNYRVISGDRPDLESGKWIPKEELEFRIEKKQQPIFQPHGSSHWASSDGSNLLVMGGGKAKLIELHPILKWHFSQFKEHLSQTDTRLMVIGYGFNDDHINEAIIEAADSGNLKLFIIDPNGMGVLDKNKGAPIYTRHRLLEELEPHLIGESMRTVTSTFGGDKIEHAKVMGFFK